jgi:hypothetical protein
MKGREYNIKTRVKILLESFWAGLDLSRIQAVVGYCEQSKETSISMRREIF